MSSERQCHCASLTSPFQVAKSPARLNVEAKNSGLNFRDRSKTGGSTQWLPVATGRPPSGALLLYWWPWMEFDSNRLNISVGCVETHQCAGIAPLHKHNYHVTLRKVYLLTSRLACWLPVAQFPFTQAQQSSCATLFLYDRLITASRHIVAQRWLLIIRCCH